MILQLNPTIPVEIVDNPRNIPLGRGTAIGWIDYSQEHHLLWIVLRHEDLTYWIVPNPFIRAASNPTMR